VFVVEVLVGGEGCSLLQVEVLLVEMDWLVGNVARRWYFFKVQGKPRSLSAKHVKEALQGRGSGSARLVRLAPMSRSGKRGPNAYSR
jgi:hypothetical protein